MATVTDKRPVGLKEVLDALYDGYDFRKRVVHDPISFPMRYERPRDIESAAFIASAFAYGKVDLFMPVIDRVLSLMGESPHEFLMGFDVRRHAGVFSEVRYRFNRPEDVVGLMHALSVVLGKFGSLEALYAGLVDKADTDTGRALAGASRELLGVDMSPVYGSDIRPHGLVHFFPSPEGGGACKRASLFLRWMVRDRDMDFGLWRWMGKQRLVIPLDTHIARVARCLGLTSRKTDGWRTAVEITEALRGLDPLDPLKYDFVLCHMGISGLCASGKCGGCDLAGFSGG